MIARFVALCLRRRKLVWLIFALMAIFGYVSWTKLDIEAYPDIADVTSQVITQYPGHAAEEVEEQVTIPLERELNGVPGLQGDAIAQYVWTLADHAGFSRRHR
jgi:cobalt-zinc-cadmium resistance protein CzcA